MAGFRDCASLPDLVTGCAGYRAAYSDQEKTAQEEVTGREIKRKNLLYASFCLQLKAYSGLSNKPFFY